MYYRSRLHFSNGGVTVNAFFTLKFLLPGQANFLQSSVSSSVMFLHTPFWQVLVRFLLPNPHVLLHSDHSDHSLVQGSQASSSWLSPVHPIAPGAGVGDRHCLCLLREGVVQLQPPHDSHGVQPLGPSKIYKLFIDKTTIHTKRVIQKSFNYQINIITNIEAIMVYTKSSLS